MILVWLVAIPTVAGLIAWLVGRYSAAAARWICLIALVTDLALAVDLWIEHSEEFALGSSAPWLVEFAASWIPQFGISVHLAVDGLSLLLVLLTLFLGVLCVAISWREITHRVGFFHFNLMWVLAGIVGVFLAVDLFLFYFFWEMMLVPMYLLIGIWGHERRIYASFKFFLFTQASGLLMLLSILGLYFIHGHTTGVYTFDYTELLGTTLAPSTAMWLMLGFFIAFAVKLPMVPVHTWLPDAHTEAPTAGSVILAGLMLKTGGYGLLRFVVPFFPDAVQRFAPVAVALAVLSILYGAILAYSQTDLKRLVAYTSVSHMGFVLLGVFTWNHLAVQGVVMQMLCHGVSTGALFIIVGQIQERTHTRDIGQLGGLWATAPRLSGIALLFALASLGQPGLGNFVAEFLVLSGSYHVYPIATVLSALVLISSAIYALWMVQAAFLGPNNREWHIADLVPREVAVMAALAIAIIWLGLFPQPFLTAAKQSVDYLQNVAGMSHASRIESATPTESTRPDVMPIQGPEGGDR